MGFLRLNRKSDGGEVAVNGREYFREAAQKLGLAGLDPVAVQRIGKSTTLKPGRHESRVGGRIARNLRRLTPEETADHRRRSERFLKQEAASFPAEEGKRVPDRQT